MLEPQSRTLLFEALRPPQDYELDYAVGTTFSLDLLALLTAPLAFTFFAMDEEDGRPTSHPLALLEAVRRHAEQISVFCQAGGIAVPPHDRLLYEHVENSVFEVNAPRDGGVFHPKVWVLRFVAADDQPVLYRLLCLSRNLTFDRSWDTALVLDGELSDRQNAYAESHPIGDFIAALPEMAVRPVPELTRQRIAQMQHEVRRVRFDIPDGFDEIAFHPLGIGAGRNRWPFEGRIDRLLVISPFLGAKALRDLNADRPEDVIVSRPDSLNEVGLQGLAGFSTIKVLSDAAEPEPGSDGESDGTEPANGETPSGGPDALLRGLHAKVYVADAGWDASVWVGSANATGAAFERNVEFLVELRGSKSRCGVESLLARTEEGDPVLGDLLVDYRPSDEPTGVDQSERQVELAAQEFRARLAQSGLRAMVGERVDDGTFSVQLRSDAPLGLPDGARLRAWPVTRRKEAATRAIEAERALLATFSGLALESVTAFYGFELAMPLRGEFLTFDFAMRLPLENAPERRREAILRAMLKNRGEVLRYLLFLLAGSGNVDPSLLLDPAARDDQSREGAEPTLFLGGTALFEMLVRTLERDPGRLDLIARVVDDLRDGDGSMLLPDGFEAIWQPVWAAREAQRA